MLKGDYVESFGVCFWLKVSTKLVDVSITDLKDGCRPSGKIIRCHTLTFYQCFYFINFNISFSK